jgi:fumarylacetoacetate (FAA) hydrolase
MFSPPGAALERGWPGRLDGDRVVQLAAQTLPSFFTGGGRAREHAVYALADVTLRPPVLHPPSVRLFEAVADGAVSAFSFRAATPVLGPDEDVPRPAGVRELDFGLGIAAVIGAEGAIAGFTLANDWTARELERDERGAGYGPSKSKDFALSLGPILVTPDELGLGGAIVARVNGVERLRDRLERAPGWAELVEHASRNTVLRPGDVLVRSSGGDPEGGRLRSGDVVELEADGIGKLRSRVQ